MGLTEGKIRKFDYRVSKVEINPPIFVDHVKTSIYYIVERRSRILGYPLWWTTNYRCRYLQIEKAIKQMADEIEITKYIPSKKLVTPIDIKS